MSSTRQLAHRLARHVTVALVGAFTLLYAAFASATAFAQTLPPDGPPYGPAPQTPVTSVAPHVTHVGSPIWQFLAVAVVAAAAVFIVDHLLAHRHDNATMVGSHA